MPMLAERRRKSKWTLNPGRRALWNNAESSGIKFGQGLMEKMGWRVGQGLGVNEQGMTEPLRISLKNDSKGIGFKDTDSIEWIQQQNDFNALLEKLSFSNDANENSACNEADAVKTRTSLEERSKHSKTRVHYHKFTRGKDLTKYSEKDLECIVGSTKELCCNSKDVKDKSDSFSKPESDQSITCAGSMVDYFSEKLQKKQSAGGNNTSQLSDACQEIEDLHGNGDEEEDDNICRVKKKKKKKEKEIKSCYEFTDIRNNYKGQDGKLINHNSLEAENNFGTSVNKDSNHGNKCLKSVSTEDCPQDISNDRNGEKGCIRYENNFGQGFSDNDSEGKYIKKLKKKRRKEIEAMENEEAIDRKKRKFDNKTGEHPEDTTPRKKKGSSYDCCYLEGEAEEINRGQKKKMECNSEEVSERRGKKKRKEKSDKTETDTVCGKSMANEEVEHCEGSTPRKKRGNSYDCCYPEGEAEEFNRSQKKKMECNSEEVSGRREKKKRKEKSDKTETDTVCGESMANEEVEHCEGSTPRKKRGNSYDCCYPEGEAEEFNRGQKKKMEYNSEEVSERRGKKKRKEKSDKTETDTVCGKSMANEEVEHCEVLKPRKKKKTREKAVAASKTVEDGDREECAQVIDYKKEKVESHAEEVPKPEKREKKKERAGKISSALDCGDGIENEGLAEYKKDSVKDGHKVRSEEVAKPGRSKKRREKNVGEDVDRVKFEEVADYENDKKNCGGNDEVRIKKVSKLHKKEKKEISDGIDCDGKKVEKKKVAGEKTDKIFSKTCQVPRYQVSEPRKRSGKKRTKKMSRTNPVAFPGSNLNRLKGYGCVTNSLILNKYTYV